MATPQPPFSTEHVYVQWGGTLPGGDIFSCGIRLAPDAPSTVVPDVTDDQANQVGAVVGTFHGDGDSMINGLAVLTYVKSNVIGVNGRYKFPVSHEFTPVGIPGGGGQNPLHPNQVALAVSTLTGSTRGPAHRGRFYLPLPAMAILPDGHVTAADCSRVRLATLRMINGLGPIFAGFNAKVMSRKNLAPAARTIVDVEVGTVLDTQRRRRNALSEAYVRG